MLNVKLLSRNLEPMTCSCQLFLQKCSLAVVWLGSKYAPGFLDAPFEMGPIDSFVCQYVCHNQFVICFQK